MKSSLLFAASLLASCATSSSLPSWSSPPTVRKLQGGGTDYPIDWIITSYDAIDVAVGDTVTFTYNSYHNVFIHPSGDCSHDGSTELGGNDAGSVTYTFTEAGPITFACQAGSHCDSGQIVTITASDGLPNIAGYAPGTDVVEHSEIDLDQDVMAVQPSGTGDDGMGGDFSALTAAYTEGGNSVKGSGAIRTLRGFSTGLDAKACPGSADGNDVSTCIEPMFANQKAYWGTGSYGNDIVTAALEGSGDYDGKADILRKEVAVKGSAYMVAGMYAIHEMEDAVLDCGADGAASDAGVHAWDEAVAFYAGSLEGPDAGGASAGELSYRLAEKRCANYGTCTGEGGISQVNANIMTAFDAGKAALATGDCDAGAVQMDIIKKQMLVPLVQGTLRYAYKADPARENPDSSPEKEIGEGWAFAIAILGEVNSCDADTANMLRTNMDIAADSAVADGYAAVVSGLQSTYSCLGITCDDVGGLVSDAGSSAGCYSSSTHQCDCESSADTCTDYWVNEGCRSCITTSYYPGHEPCSGDGSDICTLQNDGNGDGVVNVVDLLALLGDFGCTCGGCN